MCHFLIPNIWQRAILIAKLKPNKTLNDAKSYCPIFLLLVPIKILKHLIHSCIELIINCQLLPDPAGFHHGRSAVDEVTLLTQHLEDSFEDKTRLVSIFVNLRAAYDTVWRCSLTCKLLSLLPDKHMVQMIMELVLNCSLVLKTDSQQNKLRYLKNSIPQGSVLVQLQFNIYTYNSLIPQPEIMPMPTICILMHTACSRQEAKEVLNKDTARWSDYLRKWRLKLSEKKAVSASFHLKNKEAKHELNIKINGSCLTHQDIQLNLV